jgi:class 3 adenylate cyclase
MTRLAPMMDGSSRKYGDHSSTTTASSSDDGAPQQPRRNKDESWTLPSGVSVVSSSAASSRGKGPISDHPTGLVTVVYTDITRAATLWEHDASAMRDATMLHNTIVRSEIKKHGGYEVLLPRGKNNGEGCFCVVFQNQTDALGWCRDVQRALLVADWPKRLLEHPGACEITATVSNDIAFRGPRVRMGVQRGPVKISRDPITRRMEYSGGTVDAALGITTIAHGGQILVGNGVDVEKADGVSFKTAGKFNIERTGLVRLREVIVDGLGGRFFGGVSTDKDEDEEEEDDGTVTTRSDSSIQERVGHGLEHDEDYFLMSANLCRWVIDRRDITIEEQVGLGSYGVVSRGKWKGVEVAVKRIINQKLDERAMLEFRAEIAFLSELRHPHIVLFIGACLVPPELAIVTEFMRCGDLRSLLGDATVKLDWERKSRILTTAALGINYLHSLKPVIVHRDLKPSNMLIDEQGKVKISDFGFARIKEDNATMTRCGTPCWTAPEIIRGEKYDERADVYSFGIVMWQVLTRKEPYAGRNFMGVTLDVLEGKRPQLPNDCPAGMRKLMKKCWHADPAKRPTMEYVLSAIGGRQDAEA